ncbi:MAG: DNA translocase FtsK [Sulfurovum sp.]|nr:DNA translocase FtsK [Sulfurovum sp.]MCB4745186.1 DNA translocase FtsK [Sulfurovum sp.]MCB4746723.1 DNA translocase FtsK [Sulfurovum sp.]MCB4748648.1 DNA translocase FtsK [Sulfurovum sp.]MCB4750808.1 DNA translocase FtsK [Sulfurovum sp.]
MKTILIMTAILFIYGIFSTFFRDTALSGNIGNIVGNTNIYLFGSFAYMNILILFYPLYKLYTNVAVRNNIDFYLGWVLLFIGAILFESLTLEAKDAGIIGPQVVEFLRPYIGEAGLWLLWLMTITLALTFIVDDEFQWQSLVSKREKIIILFKSMGTISKSIFLKFTTGIKKIMMIIFTNHFASPKLEDEIMPFIDIDIAEDTELKTITPKLTMKQETVVKKKPKPKPKKQTDSPVFEEVLGVEPPIKKLFDTQEDKEISDTKSTASSSSVKIVKELEENSKLMETLERGKVEKPKNFKLPKLDFLQKAPNQQKKHINEAEIDRKSGNLIEKLKLFKIDGDVVRTYTGPLVTTFEFKPAPHVKVSKILGLQDDLAMALSAETIRIQAPIPGRDVVGIEIPNEHSNIIYLREILEDDLFQNSKSPLTIALGKDIVGKPFITDIKKLPHLLIAGTTGSGKSVGINAMILSLLYKNDPEHLKLMMIDPKMLEFSIYDEIPHLITPVITEPKKAIAALANMVGEMERRYRLMAEKRTKNIDNYNEKIKRDNSGDEPMPFIVIVIDELADLMMNGGKEVETSIARLAQKSRACGIHLIVATQRPSVDVVTGIIKANLPSRLSYRVGQKIDSKVILDSMGAESLLGRGDGLFTPPGMTGLVRIHAPWATEEEIEEIVEFIKVQRAPEYDESYFVESSGTSLEKGEKEIELDSLYEEAKAVVLSDKKTSISYLQRKLQIGYNRSANIIDQLEATGVLSSPNTKGNRDILI